MGGEQQFYKREIKINLAPPPPRRVVEVEEHHHHHHMLNEDELLDESKTVTTTNVVKPQPPPQPATIRSQILTTSLLTLNQQPEVQEEVLLNLFSCNNSGSISSESSESLVEFESQSKLKINEVVEQKIHHEEKKPESKRVSDMITNFYSC